MVLRELKIGRWQVEFMFAVDDYDDEAVLTYLYEMDADYEIMRQANRLMDSGGKNCGFTFANQEMKVALVVIGPTTSGREFIDTLTHEIHHLAVAIAKGVGVDLGGEDPAYLAGDSARALADIICELGCPCCNG